MAGSLIKVSAKRQVQTGVTPVFLLHTQSASTGIPGTVAKLQEPYLLPLTQSLYINTSQIRTQLFSSTYLQFITHLTSLSFGLHIWF